MVPLKLFQRLLGHMASAAAVTPLGLLHMRPLQHWLHSRVPRWAWRRGALRVNITQECRRSFSPWTDNSTGRGALRTSVSACCCHNRCLQHGLGRYMQRAGSLGALDGASTALAHQLPRAAGSASSLAAVSATAVRQACVGPHLLLWSHTRLKSLRVVHIPGELNRAADALSRQLTFPGEWRLHPEMIRLIWSRFGEAQVDLFVSRESSHCQLYFSLTEGTLGTDALAHSWPRALCKYAFPPVSLLAQTLCKVREDEEQVLLVAPSWPTRTWFPELILLATAPPWPIPLRKDLLSQGLGTIWHPRPDLWNLHVWLLDGTRQT